MSPAERSGYKELARFDAGFRDKGVRYLAGVDEAGRGALAGPVVAAAVICEPAGGLEEIRDSKLISENVRERLYDLITGNSSAWSVGIVGPEEIDRMNILQATMKAMGEAVRGLAIGPDLVIVDGNQVPQAGCDTVAVTGGDGKSFCIAAASIIAKVTRDRMMRKLDEDFPEYGFIRNKGYGTKEHLEALEKLGHAGIHRKSFRNKVMGVER